MNQRLDDVLDRVFPGVLSEFAFIFGDPVTRDAVPDLKGRAFVARLPFHGDLIGRLEVAVPEALAVVIVANTLGVESGSPAAARGSQDAVKEVASVLGSQLATSIEGQTGRIELSPPTVSIMSGDEWNRLRSDAATRSFLVDDSPAMVRVQLAPGSESA